MPVETVQCPKCGSPIQAESTASAIFCTYCGSQLRLTRGSSGHPLATLEDIQANAAIIARRAALEHLQESQAEMAKQRQAVAQELEAKLAAIEQLAPPSSVLRSQSFTIRLTMISGLLLLIVLYATLNAASDSGAWTLGMFCLTPCLAGMGFGIFMYVTSRQEAQRRQEAEEASRLVHDKYDPEIARLDEETASAQTRIDELKEEMDRLAREL